MKKKTTENVKILDSSPIDIGDGLNQSFLNSKSKSIKLKDFLKKHEWWVLKKRNSISVILTHDAVKRIADEAGIKQDPKYEVLTQPLHANNFQYLIQCTICDATGKCTTELGESNRANLGSRGRSNPANMAQKRSYDRAVFRHVGINGLLGEDEMDEEKEQNVKTLSPEQAKAIAPLLNELLAVKDKKQIDAFNKKMKVDALNYAPEQLDVLRGLRDKKLGELSKSF